MKVMTRVWLTNSGFYFACSRWVLLLVSLLIVSLGQPARSSLLGILSGSCGFALCWRALVFFPNKKERFRASFLWFALVQAIQLSWMGSTQYVGVCMLGVYFLVVLGLAFQFALFSSGCVAVYGNKTPSLLSLLSLSGGWVLLEWSRLFFMSGFTWNPVGLALSSQVDSLQLASLFGVYGLSFWVMFVNLNALRALLFQKQSHVFFWLAVALFPYGFGVIQQQFVEKIYAPMAKSVSIVLVETGWNVEEKEGANPLDLWKQIWSYLPRDVSIDLIVLPEGTFGALAYSHLYDLEEVKESFSSAFGVGALDSFPPISPPLAMPYRTYHQIKWRVNHAFLSQALANQLGADIIIGLNDVEQGEIYNTAFCFHPLSFSPETYKKRVLIPVGEYLPFSFLRWVGPFVKEHFGVSGSYGVGREATIFSAPLPIGVAICLEEVYTEIVRDLRRNGAQLLVGLSNNVWFPNSLLGQQHFDHGRIRAVENGLYFVRSTNMGITGVVDPMGRVIEKLSLPVSNGNALHLQLSCYSYPTLYTWWGDHAILILSALFLLLAYRKPCS